ncbi:MAG: hypothetical protein PHZ11_03370 [Desulfitobacteriaceae bacterium]|nr:hypothetical protein [Desulfitobacteriaceae bacterium]
MLFKNLNFIYVLDSELKISEKIKKIREAVPEFPEMNQPGKDVYILHNGKSAIGLSTSQVTFIFSGEENIKVNEIVTTLNKILKILNIKGKIRLGLKVEGFEKIELSSGELSLAAHKQEAEILGAVALGYRFIINNSFIHGDIKIEPYLKDEKQIFFDVVLQTIDQITPAEAEKGFKEMFAFATEKSMAAATSLFCLKKD